MLLNIGYSNPLFVHLNCDLDHKMGTTDLKTIQNILSILSLTSTEGWEREELVLSVLMTGDAELSTQKWKSDVGQRNKMTNVKNKCGH